MVKHKLIMAHVQVLNEVFIAYPNGYKLCFQECTYHYSKTSRDNGYRFIWRFPNGNLQPARGQARIPSKTELEVLTSKATQEGWYK